MVQFLAATKPFVAIRSRGRALHLAPLPLALAVACVTLCVTAQARITKIQITTKESPTFGGYSWPVVGQYEKIVGKAFGEVDPADPKNAVIVDIALAPRNAQRQRRVLLRLLHPEADRPEERRSQGDVRAAEPRRQDLDPFGRVTRGPGGNDPARSSTRRCWPNSFLMPRGYTMVWSGWDKSAGTDNAPTSTRRSRCRLRRTRTAPTITGPDYEYIVTGGALVHAQLSGRDAGQDEGEADAPRAPRRHAGASPGHRLGLQRRPARRSACPAATSSPTTSTSSPTPRRIRR